MAAQQCAPGQHVFNTHFGACGIIAAILLFPIGLIFLLCVICHSVVLMIVSDLMSCQVLINREGVRGAEWLGSLLISCLYVTRGSHSYDLTGSFII